MKVRIITVGKPSSEALRTVQADYERRLGRWVTIEWILLPHQKTAVAENTSIMNRIADRDFVVLLDERGKQVGSTVLAEHLDQWLLSGRLLVFVIGGAFGVTNALRGRADYVWSFSLQTFPHQLMRLLLLEQLYRSFAIRDGGKYHHE